jgi:hypothetical protein
MSSTATLMKRYEAPHIAARMRINGQYERTERGYRRRLDVPHARSDAADKLAF